MRPDSAQAVVSCALCADFTRLGQHFTHVITSVRLKASDDQAQLCRSIFSSFSLKPHLVHFKKRTGISLCFQNDFLYSAGEEHLDKCFVYPRSGLCLKSVINYLYCQYIRSVDSEREY